MQTKNVAKADIDPLIPEKEAAERLLQQPRTLTVWRSTGKGPRYMKIGRHVFYRSSWIDEYLDSLVIDPKSRKGRGK